MTEQGLQKRKGEHQRGVPHHHGKTPAAWTGSMMSAVGFLVAAVGFFLNINWVVVWIGFAIVAAGVLAGYVMRKMGLGQE